MRKIISLFQRNYEGDRLVRDEVIPEAAWVLDGEGVATRKFDGTCARIVDGKLFKRYDAQNGKQPPPGFQPAQEPDLVTGHWPGWVPVTDAPEDVWFREAFARIAEWPNGTYELCGPKVQGNPEGFEHHSLIPHGNEVLDDCPRSFEDLKNYLVNRSIEGVVWHHPDGRMVKLKRRDFVKSGAKRKWRNGAP